MNKKGLVILNIGLLIIVLSAVGEDMVINYFSLIAGLFVAGIGAIMVFAKKKKVEEGSEKSELLKY